MIFSDMHPNITTLHAPVVVCPPLAGGGCGLAGLGPVEEDGESGAGHAPGLGGVAQGEVCPRQPRHPLHRDDDGVVLRPLLLILWSIHGVNSDLWPRQAGIHPRVGRHRGVEQRPGHQPVHAVPGKNICS